MTQIENSAITPRSLSGGVAFFACVCVFVACSGAASNDPQGSPGYEACIKASSGDLAVMRDCGVAEQEQWDQKRAAVYERMLASAELDPTAKNRLQAVQAAWDQFQRLNCWFECQGFPECGTAERLAMAECSWQMSRERFLDLERLESLYTSRE